MAYRCPACRLQHKQYDDPDIMIQIYGEYDSHSISSWQCWCTIYVYNSIYSFYRTNIINRFRSPTKYYSYNKKQIIKYMLFSLNDSPNDSLNDILINDIKVYILHIFIDLLSVCYYTSTGVLSTNNRVI